MSSFKSLILVLHLVLALALAGVAAGSSPNPADPPAACDIEDADCVVEDDGDLEDFDDEGVEDEGYVDDEGYGDDEELGDEDVAGDDDFVDFGDEDGDGDPSATDEDDDDDGVADAKDFDRDNDGVVDSRDGDDDGDGIADATDYDDDNDAIADRSDFDDDNDDVGDRSDPDNDNDGVADLRDSDDDNDSVPDLKDLDFDNDGSPAARDKDDDGDGIADARDLDDDNDGLADGPDADDDNDGVSDKQEAKAKAKHSAEEARQETPPLTGADTPGSDPGHVSQGLGQVEIQGVEELDGRVRGVHGHIARDVEKRFGVVEDDLDAGVDQVVRGLLGVLGGHGEHADDDVVLPDRLAQLAVGLNREPPDATDRVAGLVGIRVENDGDVDPVLGEDRRAGDRLAEPARADERDVVLPLRAQDLADLAEQRVDVVADAALAELAEGREVAADLGGVDVRVVRDLLRGNPVLAHLLGLRQNLQVAGETRSNTHRQPISQRATFLRFVTTAHIVPTTPVQGVGNRQQAFNRRRSASGWTKKVKARSPSISTTGIDVRYAASSSGSPSMSTRSKSPAHTWATTSSARSQR